MIVLNDGYSSVDKFGNNIYKNGIVKVIETVIDDEDSLNSSFTIGIYGKWGVGKTSLLKQIKLDIDKKEESKILTLWFNPWIYTAEEHLIIPFFYTLINKINKINNYTKFDKEALKNLQKEFTKIVKAFIYATKTEVKIPLIHKIQIDGSKFIDSKKDSNTNIEDKYDSTYYDLINTIEEVIIKSNIKIIAFIDDLDRCLPEKAIELLESFKVLLDLKNFVFVLGADHEVIHDGIKERYSKQYANSFISQEIVDRYLDKIIQFQFTLPQPNSESIKNEILNKLISKYDGVDSSFVEVIHNTLGSNPRTIKRFINSFSFALYVDSQKESQLDKSLITKISLLSYLYPKLHRVFEEKPYSIIALQNSIFKESSRNVINLSSDEVLDSLLLKRVDDSGIDREKNNEIFNLIFNFGKEIFKKENIGDYINVIKTFVENKKEDNTDIDTITKLDISNKIKNAILNRLIEVDVINKDKNYKIKMDKYLMTIGIYSILVSNKQIKNLEENYNKPINEVSWGEAIEFCNKLSEYFGYEKQYEINERNITKINRDKKGFRLPTESEWLYISKTGYNDSHKFNIDTDVCYRVQSPCDVGKYRPNHHGIYDMVGNIKEWCEDENITAQDNDIHQAIGGSYLQQKQALTPESNSGINFRGYNKQKVIGFRIVLNLEKG